MKNYQFIHAQLGSEFQSEPAATNQHPPALDAHYDSVVDEPQSMYIIGSSIG